MFHIDGLQPLNAPRTKTLATATLKEGQYIKKLSVLKGAAKHSGGGENSWKMQTFDCVSGLHKCLKFFQPPLV